MAVRVLLWSELFWPYVGGAEVFAADLLRALRERGFDCAVVTSQDYLDLPDEDSFHGIPVYRFPFRAALQPQRLHEALRLRSRAADLLAKLRPHLVHLNGVGPNAFFCVEALRRNEVPLLARLNQEFCGASRDGRGDSVVERALARASWTVAVSEALLRDARAIAPAITASSSVIYNGVAVPERATPASVEPPILLCLGRLVREKGFDTALAAFAAIAARDPHCRLRIAGDGPQRRELEGQAAALGIGARVEMMGWVRPEDVPATLAAASLVLMPSTREGLPSVALQAAACGRPVVATRAGGLGEIVVDGETGLLVDNAEQDLAAAVARLLADPPLLARMGEAARRRARAVFSRDRCIDAYAKLYRQLAGGEA